MFVVQGDAAKGHEAMSLSKPTSIFTAGLVIVSFAACLGASAAAADGQHSKRATRRPGIAFITFSLRNRAATCRWRNVTAFLNERRNIMNCAAGEGSKRCWAA
jgi:hypothetical protein